MCLKSEVEDEIMHGLRCIECSVQLANVERAERGDHRYCTLCASHFEHDDVIIDESRVAQSVYLLEKNNG